LPQMTVEMDDNSSLELQGALLYISFHRQSFQ
jgi:hypothetical protein